MFRFRMHYPEYFRKNGFSPGALREETVPPGNHCSGTALKKTIIRQRAPIHLMGMDLLRGYGFVQGIWSLFGCFCQNRKRSGQYRRGKFTKALINKINARCAAFVQKMQDPDRMSTVHTEGAGSVQTIHHPHGKG